MAKSKPLFLCATLLFNALGGVNAFTCRSKLDGKFRMLPRHDPSATEIRSAPFERNPTVAAITTELKKFASVATLSLLVLIGNSTPAISSESSEVPPDFSSIKYTPSSKFIETTAATSNQSPSSQSFPLGGLKAPTEEQPQITFSGGGDVGDDSGKLVPQANPYKKGGKVPILQGLVYLQDLSAERPNPNDSLVLTATRVAGDSDASTMNKPIAGAKILLTKTRFPLQFSMSEENILQGQNTEWGEASKGDIIITARVCPEEIMVEAKLKQRTPCSDEESVLKATGITKLIGNIPGLQEGTVVRSAAALPLH